MRRWVTACLVVAVCLCLAIPALVEAQETVTSKYNVKIWGRVKFDIHYDTAQFVRYNDFVGVPADRQKVGGVGSDVKNDSTDFNPRDTRLGVSASHAVGAWASKGVIEIDFYGDKQASGTLIPRMRLAYVDLANKDTGTSIRAGQDWNPVQSLNPSTIDFGILTATGNLWWRRPQVVVRQNLDLGDTAGMQFLAGCMMGTRTSTASESRMPWLVGRVALNLDVLDGKHMIAIDGAYQGDKAKGATGDDAFDRWLAGLEAKFNFGPVLVKGELWTGQGIGGDYLRYDLDTRTSGAGHVRPWDAWGGWMDVTVKIIPEWSVTAGVGIDDPQNNRYKQRRGDDDRTFKRSYNAYVNTWYSLAKDTKVGFEFQNIEAKRDGPTGNYHDDGQRYTISMYYGF